MLRPMQLKLSNCQMSTNMKMLSLFFLFFSLSVGAQELFVFAGETDDYTVKIESVGHGVTLQNILEIHSIKTGQSAFRYETYDAHLSTFVIGESPVIISSWASGNKYEYLVITQFKDKFSISFREITKMYPEFINQTNSLSSYSSYQSIIFSDYELDSGKKSVSRIYSWCNENYKKIAVLPYKERLSYFLNENSAACVEQ